MNNMATTVFTIGQILIGMMGVLAPVSPVQPAITSSIKADARYTITETGLADPARRVVQSANMPIKHRVRPSATHSIVMMSRLSSVIAPKPSTTDWVGTM